MKDLFFSWGNENVTAYTYSSMRCNILHAPSDILCTDCGLLWLLLFIKYIYKMYRPIIQNSNFIMWYFVCSYARPYTGYTPWQKRAEKFCELCNGEWLNSSCFHVYFILQVTTPRPNAYTDHLFCNLSVLLHLSPL